MHLIEHQRILWQDRRCGSRIMSVIKQVMATEIKNKLFFLKNCLFQVC